MIQFLLGLIAGGTATVIAMAAIANKKTSEEESEDDSD